MKDVFYTILVVWIIWRIINAVSTYGARRGEADGFKRDQGNRPEGETTLKYVPPVEKKISDDEGEYVDFEEMK